MLGASRVSTGTSGDQDRELRVPLARAALIWLAYSIIQLVINGIVLDETVIAAQVIAGSVAYPSGHPHEIYYWSAFSLPHYLSAGLWFLIPSAEVISALRNVLFLFLSTMSIFTLALVLTRSSLWGHVAVALVLLESAFRFEGVYPIFVFPNIYSNGHIGIQVAILTVALLFGRMWRSAGLLLGLLPAIHGTVALLIWPWAGLYILLAGLLRDSVARTRLLIWGGLGCLACLGLWILIGAVTPEGAVAPLYQATGDGEAIREQFRLMTDVHRQPIDVRRFAYLVNPIAFFALCAMLWLRGRVLGPDSAPDRPMMMVLTGLGIVIWTYLLGTRLFEALVGPPPDFILLTMPNRFSNLSAGLLIGLTAVGLSWGVRSLGPRSRAVASLLLAGGLLAIALAGSPLLEWTRRDLTRHLIPLVWGVLFGVEAFVARESRYSRTVLGSAAAIGVALALFIVETLTVVYVAVIAGLTFAALQIAGRVRLPQLRRTPSPRAVATGALLVMVVGCASLALPGRTRDRLQPQYVRWDMASADDRAIGEWLRSNASRDEMVLAGYLPRSELQVKTSQPVLFEMKTMWIMTYMPDLAPLINRMVHDLYGVDYGNAEQLSRLCPDGRLSAWCRVWDDNWADRTRDEWREVGGRYGFRLVVNESRVPLDLEVAVAGERWTLYTID
jgi:hypothetical protein